MTAPQLAPRSAAEFESGFRESRIETLVSVNLNTYWSIASILAGFSIWDYYADPEHWVRALAVRLAGALIVIATGIYQNLPGKARSIVLMSKVRLIVAAVASIVAASLLDRGYGFGVAGLVVIFLTGPYIALDSHDLVKTNVAGIIAIFITLAVVSLEQLEVVGTIVFVLLAVIVSMLLGRVLEASNRRAYALELEQHRDARTDALTGLPNRRAIQERGRRDAQLATRTGVPVSLVLADFDQFKSINDKYGHEAGDAVLVKTAQILRDQLRDSDALGRWGGEEFVAVLPATHAAGAHGVAEKLRDAIATAKFDHIAERQTISVGVATSQGLDDAGLEWDLLIKEADRRLYRAKHEGRNRVISL